MLAILCMAFCSVPVHKWCEGLIGLCLPQFTIHIILLDSIQSIWLKKSLNKLKINLLASQQLVRSPTGFKVIHKQSQNDQWIQNSVLLCAFYPLISPKMAGMFTHSCRYFMWVVLDLRFWSDGGMGGGKLELEVCKEQHTPHCTREVAYWSSSMQPRSGFR